MSVSETRISRFGWKSSAIAVVIVAVSFVGLQVSAGLGVSFLASKFFGIIFYVATLGAALAALLAIVGHIAEYAARHE